MHSYPALSQQHKVSVFKFGVVQHACTTFAYGVVASDPLLDIKDIRETEVKTWESTHRSVSLLCELHSIVLNFYFVESVSERLPNSLRASHHTSALNISD